MVQSLLLQITLAVMHAFGTYKRIKHVTAVKCFWNVSSNTHKPCKTVLIIATALLSTRLKGSGLQRSILLQSMEKDLFINMIPVSRELNSYTVHTEFSLTMG